MSEPEDEPLSSVSDGVVRTVLGTTLVELLPTGHRIHHRGAVSRFPDQARWSPELSENDDDTCGWSQSPSDRAG